MAKLITLVNENNYVFGSLVPVKGAGVISAFQTKNYPVIVDDNKVTSIPRILTKHGELVVALYFNGTCEGLLKENEFIARFGTEVTLAEVQACYEGPIVNVVRAQEYAGRVPLMDSPEAFFEDLTAPVLEFRGHPDDSEAVGILLSFENKMIFHVGTYNSDGQFCPELSYDPRHNTMTATEFTDAVSKFTETKLVPFPNLRVSVKHISPFECTLYTSSEEFNGKKVDQKKVANVDLAANFGSGLQFASLAGTHASNDTEEIEVQELEIFGALLSAAMGGVYHPETEIVPIGKGKQITLSRMESLFS